VTQSNFYQVGGDLKFQHPSYISRQSDSELYQAIESGDFCYVLNCRQMGKSSLAVQVFHRLKLAGYACCFISLSDIGSNGVTIDSWYFTLAHKIARKLRIDLDFEGWWQQQQLLSPIGKFSQFIEEILLTKIDQDIVIFIDEVDSVRRLEFSVDDFFALVRSCYNRRVNQPQYQKLRFTFLGVASPSNLISNSDCTPFNIGTAIVLDGFKLGEARLLAKGLENKTDRSEEIIAEILKWTGGQPFLTQKLCKLIAESTNLDFDLDPQLLVEQVVRSRIINNWTEQDNPQHLKTIQDRILDRAQLTIKLLWLYKEVLDGNEIPSDSSPEQVELRLSGLVIDRDNQFKVFSPIYQEVFNSNWLIQKLSELSIPYLDKMIAWEKSHREDRSQLLTKEALINALQWANGKNLSLIDWQYLNASETAIITTEKYLATRKFRQAELLFSSFAIGAIMFGSIFFHRYASCPIYRGEVGERIGDICFRSLSTSGEKPAIISSHNLYLTRGIGEFNHQKYLQAKILFKKAIDSDRTDPVAQIFYNNTQARLQKNSLKIAAVVPIDYYENAALDILRGVADAQTHFNQQRQDQNARLLEVVIINDGNKAEAARKVSQELANDQEILAVVGHHFSSSTIAALPQYEQAGVAVVSPTSSSSKLERKVFFPTIISTKDFAEIYAAYFSKQKLTKIAIIDFSSTNNSDTGTTENNEYTETFYDDFKAAIEIKSIGGKIVNPQDRGNDSIKQIQQKYPEAQAILAITSGETNSAMIALARQNSTIPNDQRIKLFATHAIVDQETLARSGKAMEGIRLISLCQNSENSAYIRYAKERWEQEDIYWRTGYSYDATQKIVKAISQSSANPTRQEILNKLQSIELTNTESSGFVLFNDEKSRTSDKNSVKELSCLLKVENGKFIKVKESKK
jgi:ABC-type branched-subunit amino acid transport system substrate-binding protein